MSACRIVPVNYADLGTLTVSSEVSNFLGTNLQSNVSDRVWRSADLTEQIWNLDWGGDSYDISSWAIRPSNMLGSQVRVLMFDGVGSPSNLLYDSGVLDFLSFAALGWGTYAWGRFPWSRDPARALARRATLARYFEVVLGVKSMTFIITNATMVGSYFEARRLWVGEYVDAGTNVKTEGAAAGWASNSEQSRKVAKALRRLPRDRWREMKFEVLLTSEAERVIWNNLLFVCDPGNEILFSLFQNSAKQEEDWSVMGSLRNLNPPTVLDYNLHTLLMEIVES